MQDAEWQLEDLLAHIDALEAELRQSQEMLNERLSDDETTRTMRSARSPSSATSCQRREHRPLTRTSGCCKHSHPPQQQRRPTTRALHRRPWTRW